MDALDAGLRPAFETLLRRVARGPSVLRVQTLTATVMDGVGSSR